MSRIRVSVTLTVELDAEAWMEHQGIAREDVRQDVREYVQHLVQGSVFLDEAQATVELKGRGL